MSIKRYRVAEESMRPTLEPGEEVVATDSRPARIGDLVVFLHPERSDFWMVKRMVEPPMPIGDDEAWVLSDNPGLTRADSRSLGPLPRGVLMPVVERLDPQSFVEACELLAEEDASLATAMETFGIPEFWQRSPGLPTLVWLILEQQVSLESGAAMYRRVHRLTGSVTAETLAEAGTKGLTSIGVTRQKAGYITDLAQSVLEASVDLDAIGAMSRHQAREALLWIRGVGPWTADLYLLAALGHPDVFPADDLALRVGTGEVMGMGRPPTADELDVLSEPWRPVRAAAARLIWHVYLARRGRSEPADPSALRA